MIKLIIKDARSVILSSHLMWEMLVGCPLNGETTLLNISAKVDLHNKEATVVVVAVVEEGEEEGVDEVGVAVEAVVAGMLQTTTEYQPITI